MATPPQMHRDPMFAIYHEFVEPQPEGNMFESHNDIIAFAWQAIKHPNLKNYDPETDLFFFDGNAWKMRDCYYLARKVNTEHPYAFQWLTDQGYDIEGAPMGWVFEFVFDNGRSLTTAHRFDVRHSLRLKFGETVFVLLDTALVNLHRVVHYNSIWANLDLHAEHLQKRPAR